MAELSKITSEPPVADFKQASVVVAVCAMHMLVGDFFSGGDAYFSHFQREAQYLAGPGVVAVEVHGIALDFHNVEHLLGAVITHAFELATHLHAGRELAAGDGLYQAFVAQTKGVSGFELQGGGVAGVLAVQRSFDFGQCVSVAAMQVGHGFADVFDQKASGVGDFVGQGDNGVLGDVHGFMARGSIQRANKQIRGVEVRGSGEGAHCSV